MDTSSYTRLYPCVNHSNLSNIIQRHFDASRACQHYQVLGITVSGEGGTGKTKYMEYALQVKLAQYLRLTEAPTTLTEGELGDYFKGDYWDVKVEGSTVFFFDDLDKRLSLRAEIEFEGIHRKKGMEKKDFLECYYASVRIALASMLNRRVDHPVVIVLVTNNVNIGGDGYLGMKFGLCEREEIIRIIVWWNERFRGTPRYRSVDEKSLSTISISCSHRRLYHTLLECDFDITSTLGALDVVKQYLPALPSLLFDGSDATQSETDEEDGNVINTGEIDGSDFDILDSLMEGDSVNTVGTGDIFGSFMGKG